MWQFSHPCAGCWLWPGLWGVLGQPGRCWGPTSRTKSIGGTPDASNVRRRCRRSLEEGREVMRSVFNFSPGGEMWPHGIPYSTRVEVIPYGWIYPLGMKPWVRQFVYLNGIECSPLGWTKGWTWPPGLELWPLGGQLLPWGLTLPLGGGWN
jgi:hypothetical protein